MPRFLRIAYALTALAVSLSGAAAAQGEPIRVVTSLSTYAAIAREIAGDRAEVASIAEGDENPHFVQPKPSFVLLLRRADLFVTTGLDLELWVPALVDKASNPRIRSGQPGFVTAYPGIRLLNVPAAVSRSEGDIHLFGNPHIWTDPANAIIIGGNILTGLKRVSPANTDLFERRFQAWKVRVLRAYVGDSLVQLLSADVVFDLAREGTLRSFLRSQSYQGRPLADRVGGWLAQSAAFDGREMVCYHKEWDYFSRAFGVPCVDYVEPKPGIPPTPRHVAEIISLMRERRIPVLFSTNYYDRNQVQSVAQRTGATAVIVPSNTGGAPGTDTYIDLVSQWIRELAKGFGGAAAAP